MNDGFILIPRDDPLWDLKPDERDVFLWFLREAAWKNHDRPFKNRTIMEKRGEKTVTESLLCDVFRLSRKQLQRIIGTLIEGNFIEKKGTIRGTIGGTIYHVVNYDTYQPPGDNSGDNSRDNVPEEGIIQKKKDIKTLVPVSEKPKPERRFTDQDTEHAKMLESLLNENNPFRKSSSATQLEKWADTCRLMRERDARSQEDIEEHIRFSQKDDFWKQNILSMDKLREKYDQLTLKMNGGDNGYHKKNPNIFLNE